MRMAVQWKRQAWSGTDCSEKTCFPSGHPSDQASHLSPPNIPSSTYNWTHVRLLLVSDRRSVLAIQKQPRRFRKEPRPGSCSQENSHGNGKKVFRLGHVLPSRVRGMFWVQFNLHSGKSGLGKEGRNRQKRSRSGWLNLSRGPRELQLLKDVLHNEVTKRFVGEERCMAYEITRDSSRWLKVPLEHCIASGDGWGKSLDAILTEL